MKLALWKLRASRLHSLLMRSLEVTRGTTRFRPDLGSVTLQHPGRDLSASHRQRQADHEHGAAGQPWIDRTGDGHTRTLGARHRERPRARAYTPC
jgi:hypothetical protein